MPENLLIPSVRIVGGYGVIAGAEFRAVFILFIFFPFILAFDVGGLGFEFCVFVAGWKHALWSEWPKIQIVS